MSSTDRVSVVVPTFTPMSHHHHPWRAFRDLVDWTLHWAQLPHGIWGVTDFRARTVTLTLGMNQAERRCTIEHERQHILRGPVASMHHVAREELVVDRNAARLLLPDVRQIGEALAWAACLDEAAEELWVDVEILRVRLKGLHPAERAFLKNRLEETGT